MTDIFSKALVHIVDSGEVNKLGLYRFGIPPRTGETIMLGEDSSQVWLRIVEVIHSPEESSVDPCGAITILNCEHFVL